MHLLVLPYPVKQWLVFYSEKGWKNYKLYVCVCFNHKRDCVIPVCCQLVYTDRQYGCRYTISLLKTEIIFLYFISYSPYILEVCRRHSTGEELWPIVISTINSDYQIIQLLVFWGGAAAKVFVWNKLWSNFGDKTIDHVCNPDLKHSAWKKS